MKVHGCQGCDSPRDRADLGGDFSERGLELVRDLFAVIDSYETVTRRYEETGEMLLAALRSLREIESLASPLRIPSKEARDGIRRIASGTLDRASESRWSR